MRGCIALFEGVDPNVALIETFAGGERDTAFRRPKTGWEAISPGAAAHGGASSPRAKAAPSSIASSGKRLGRRAGLISGKAAFR